MLSARPMVSALTIAVIAVALVAFWAFSENGPVAQAQSSCEAIDLGTLGDDVSSVIQGDGRWTTNDCDSRFRSDSDSHMYRFEVEEGGRIRVELKSTEADSYLYLLAEDGSRIADDDDGGASLDARVERDLEPGVYLAEATTVGGRDRGQADFTISVSRVAGCETEHLGTLVPGTDLTATDSWTLDTCGSRFVVQHPAHGYSFFLPSDGRVVIDLTSENGDPVLSLVSESEGLIAANDDGGERRNSRIEKYLAAGSYFVEATTYLERDLQPLFADFELVVSLVDEDEMQKSFLLKIEETQAPDEVVAGVPFPVHYRIGNLGGGDLADVNGSAFVYVVAPRFYRPAGSIDSSDGRWRAGVSYHSGPETEIPTSSTLREVKPFNVTLNRTGPSWVFVAVLTYDEADEEVGFHGIWRTLMVLSGVRFDEVTVDVDGTAYQVSAEADMDGMATVSVSEAADSSAEVDEATRAKAIYAAGVHTQMLDGIFERMAIADLPTTAEALAVSVADPSSETLIKAFAEGYTDAVVKAGLGERLEAGEAIDPTAVEEIVLGASETAASQFASLAASWKAVQERIEGGGRLSVEEAFAVQSELAYAERVLSPLVKAGDIVRAARAADLGWEDAEVQAMSERLADQGSCGRRAASLRDLLEDTGSEGVSTLLEVDAEVRVALPIYGSAIDAALCAVAASDTEVSQFLESLSIDDSEEIRVLFGHEPLPAAVQEDPAHRLRIIARLGEDGRVELGAELAGGEQVLPTVRYLAADSTADVWRISSDVEVDGNPIGKIRARRLEDGRIELGFLSTGGEMKSPDIRYLPADMTTDVWLRSGEIETPTVEVLTE